MTSDSQGAQVDRRLDEGAQQTHGDILSARNATVVVPWEEPISCCSSVQTSSMHALLKGKVGLVRVPKYVDKIVLEHALRRQSLRGTAEYENAPGVGKVGDMHALYETQVSEQIATKYYASSRVNMDLARADYLPYLSPLDRFRLELDECFPAGAQLLQLPGGKASAGLTRIMTEPVKAHNDKLERDLGIDPAELGYHGQLAFNCYLKVPEQGGELLIWNHDMDEETFKHLSQGSYGIELSKLPAPDLIYRPQQGDMALFMPRNLHAIGGSTDGSERVSMSAFVMYKGEAAPMQVFS